MLLIDHNSGKPYPMVMVGDFCLIDQIFPGTSRDSLLFNGKDLTKIKRRGYHVSTFKEQAAPRRKNNHPPMPWKMC